MTASHTTDDDMIDAPGPPPGAMPLFSTSPRLRTPAPVPVAEPVTDAPVSDSPVSAAPVSDTPDVAESADRPTWPANVGPNPDFPHNSVPDTPPAAAHVDSAVEAPEEVTAPPAASGDVVPVGAPLPAPRPTPSHGLAVARAHDGLPMVLDPFAVASRAVLVLIGSIEPAKHIARTAIEMSIEHDSSAAIDVVIPRAIDLVLRRAAHLVSIGAGPKVVDHYTERLELWRRLARRSGLEPAAIVLTLAPFPIPTVASMLRVSLAEVEACVDDWYAGIDPEDNRPKSLTAGQAPGPADAADPEEVVDLRDSVREPTVTVPAAVAGRPRRTGWARLRLRHA